MFYLFWQCKDTKFIPIDQIKSVKKHKWELISRQIPIQTTKNLTILNYGKQRASKQRKSRIFVPLVGLEPTTSPQGGSALPTELLGLKNVRCDTSEVLWWQRQVQLIASQFGIPNLGRIESTSLVSHTFSGSPLVKTPLNDMGRMVAVSRVDFTT